MRYIIALFLLLITAPAAAQTAACRNAVSYGADPTGATSSNAAFNAAIAATDGVHICVYFPAGLYSFASTIYVSLPTSSNTASVTIIGDSSETTQFKFGTGISGIDLELSQVEQSFHVRHLSLLTSDQGNSTHGLHVGSVYSPNAAQSHIDDVTVRGLDGYALVNRWFYGIDLYQVSNVNITNTSVFGARNGQAYASSAYCLVLQGTANAIAVEINVVASQFNYCQYGISYGNYLQGLQVSSSTSREMQTVFISAQDK